MRQILGEKQMKSEEPEIDYIPLVSVLMPCYNHEGYVISSLKSVAANNYRFIELIFIDDASEDNSFKIAKKWLEDNQERFVRTVCVQHKKNLGICKTFNELCALSNGKYINMIASDDLLLVDAISKQVNFLSSRCVDFVFSDCLLIDQSGKQISDSMLKYFGKNREKLKRKIRLTTEIILSWNGPWNKFFMKSDLIEKIGPFDENLCFEDRDFITRVLINGSFEFMADVTSAYRIRLKNLLTPGLIFEELMSDFRKADCKNYSNSSGLTKLLLGLVVYSYEERYRELGIENAMFIRFAILMTNCLKALVQKVHRTQVRCTF